MKTIVLTVTTLGLLAAVAGAKPEAPSPPVEAKSLDRGSIERGIAGIKSKVAACGQAKAKGTVKGTVKVTVEVAPDGSVTSVLVRKASDEKLGTCVADAVKLASFTKTTKGGTFNYPFVF